MYSGITFQADLKNDKNYIAMAPNSDFYRYIKDFFTWDGSDKQYMAMTHDSIVMNGISTVNRIIDDNMFLELRFADRYWIDGITFYVIPGIDEIPDATKGQLKLAALTLESQSICFDSEWTSDIL